MYLPNCNSENTASDATVASAKEIDVCGYIQTVIHPHASIYLPPTPGQVLGTSIMIQAADFIYDEFLLKSHFRAMLKSTKQLQAITALHLRSIHGITTQLCLCCLHEPINWYSVISSHQFIHKLFSARLGM